MHRILPSIDEVEFSASRLSGTEMSLRRPAKYSFRTNIHPSTKSVVTEGKSVHGKAISVLLQTSRVRQKSVSVHQQATRVIKKPIGVLPESKRVVGKGMCVVWKGKSVLWESESDDFFSASWRRFIRGNDKERRHSCRCFHSAQRPISKRHASSKSYAKSIGRFALLGQRQECRRSLSLSRLGSLRLSQ